MYKSFINAALLSAKVILVVITGCAKKEEAPAPPPPPEAPAPPVIDYLPPAPEAEPKYFANERPKTELDGQEQD